MTSARYRSILGCKIDLFALDHRDVEGLPVLRAALEIKRPKSNFSEFRRDIERLEALTSFGVGRVMATISLMMCQGVRNWPFWPASAILPSMYS